MSQNLIVKIGNNLSKDYATINSKGCRTQEQYDTFIQIYNSNDIAYLCNNPFEYNGKNYKYTFCFVYVSKDNDLVLCRITPKGKVKNKIAHTLNN